MTLKAYRVDGAWSSLVYATNAGQAKWFDIQCYEPDARPDFDCITARRVRRVPQCDQFATFLGVDEDYAHQVVAGIAMDCQTCGRSIYEGDRWYSDHPDHVICGHCLDRELDDAA